MTMNTLLSMMDVLYVVFRCGVPVNIGRTQLTNPRKCTTEVPDLTMVYLQACTTTITDILYLAVPVYIVWNLQMPLRKKIPVGAVLSLGVM